MITFCDMCGHSIEPGKTNCEDCCYADLKMDEIPINPKGGGKPREDESPLMLILK